MMGAHWFWYLLVAAVMIWYSTVTVYVAVRGVLDIKHMLARLAENEGDTPREPPCHRTAGR